MESLTLVNMMANVHIGMNVSIHTDVIRWKIRKNFAGMKSKHNYIPDFDVIKCENIIDTSDIETKQLG